MKLYPHFVLGGVYLRTSTGELIGRYDNPGEPFETLEEGRDKADWLEMVLHFQNSRRALPNDNLPSVPKPSPRSRVVHSYN
jgi:hypothetical protein